MIVSNDINMYAATPDLSGNRVSGAVLDTEADNQSGGSQSYNEPPNQRSSKVVTESDGSTVMQYTTITPGGAIMRKNVMLHEANAFSPDPLNPSPMLRRRTEAYEGMMQIF